MKFNTKYFWNILLIVCVTSVAMYFTLRDNFSEVVKAISGMNIFMLLLVLAWGLLYTGVWGISYQIMGQRYVKNYSLLKGIEVAFVGTFFAGITPSATGGQFGQIYVLKKQGIKYSDGASLLWADFIIYQTAMMIYVTILFILRFAHYANLSAWFWIVFAGYIINLIVVVGLYTIALFPKFYLRLVRWASKLLPKIKFIKNPDRIVTNLISQVENFTVEIKKLSEARPMIIKCLLVNFLRLTLYYSLPYVIARSLGIGLHLNQLVDVLALSSFVSMANSFIPLPGASGGTEVVFSLLFTGMLGKLTGAVLLLWRMSSYYVPVIAGAVVFMFFKSHYDHLDELSHQLPNGPKKELSGPGGHPKPEPAALPDPNAKDPFSLSAQIRRKADEAAGPQPAMQEEKHRIS